jgi:hypothetical protein
LPNGEIVPELDESNCIIFNSKQTACPRWPVRVTGQQGLWRYIGPINSESVEVIGPFFPNNPERNGGRSRIIKLNQIKYAGRNAKPIDVTNVEVTAISEHAKRAQRR